MFGVPAANMACLVTCRCNFLALFLPKECGKEPSWLGSRKK